MYKPKRVVVHHSGGNWGNTLYIDELHKSFGYTGNGYHLIILNGYINHEDWKAGRVWEPLVGSIETGRRFDLDDWIEANEKGAHVLGYNKDSIGICAIHKDGDHPDLVLKSLFEISRFLMKHFDSLHTASFVGHYEIDPINKPLCPSIDMDWFRKRLQRNPSFFSFLFPFHF